MSAIKTVGIVGSGTMGTGIAIVVARAGLKTIVLD
ncbi:MAG TPA: 3-hydroxyacyl-CoA dehydrogenase NAD-binding domain-containing protein, partial [Bordetella sp.]|nr:3-hydroxyacyl-CoA dehydrogenase NAD-binding domain-containing protein [Bordetella sp.]